jgi:hypothetical protein
VKISWTSWTTSTMLTLLMKAIWYSPQRKLCRGSWHSVEDKHAWVVLSSA